jgi:hypothetical protein
VDAIVKFLNEGKIKRLTVTGGGEPFLDDASVEAFAQILERSRVQTVGVVTNGKWAAKASRMKKVINRIDRALIARQTARNGVPIQCFELALSIDRYHHPDGIRGAANILGEFIRNGERLFNTITYPFPHTDICFKVSYDGDAGATEKVFRKLGARLRRKLGKGRLDIRNLKDIMQRDLTGVSGYTDCAIAFKTYPRDIFLGCFLMPVENGPRLPSSAAKKVKVYPAEIDSTEKLNIAEIDMDLNISPHSRKKIH